MDKTNLEKIKEAAEEFFAKTGLNIEVEVKNIEEQTIPINLKTDEPQLLIGERGQTLAEIQRLLKIVLKKTAVCDTAFYINLDINEYKKKKIEYLKEIAKTTADEVVLTKTEKQLSPMSAFERRVVHMELASREDVITESSGQEPERTIVIKPCS